MHAESGDKGLFTYYVSQNQGFLDPPSPLRQQWSAFGLPHFPLRQQWSAIAILRDLSSKSGLFRDYFWTMVPIGTKSGNWDFCASTALIYTGPPVLTRAISLWINHSKAPILMWHVSVRKESPLRGVALIHVVWSSLFCLVNSWMGDRLNIFNCHSRTTVMQR